MWIARIFEFLYLFLCIILSYSKKNFSPQLKLYAKQQFGLKQPTMDSSCCGDWLMVNGAATSSPEEYCIVCRTVLYAVTELINLSKIIVTVE